MLAGTLTASWKVELICLGPWICYSVNYCWGIAVSDCFHSYLILVSIEHRTSLRLNEIPLSLTVHLLQIMNS